MVGSGTAVDPYVIQNVTDLQAMEDDLDAYYELGGNINAADTSTWNANAGFVPVGTDGDEFEGNFDGKGYTITGLAIARPTERYVGLFGKADAGSYIRNVGLVTCSISGERDVGALVGYVSGQAISGCYSTGTVDGVLYYVGGLIGDCDSDVDDCYSTCTVTCTGGANNANNVGGLIGYVEAAIIDSYATGSVTVTSDATARTIGGFAGALASGDSIARCSATGNVSATADKVSYIGGFIGDSAADISNCYARGNITATATDPTGSGGEIGGFVGYHDLGTLDDCYSTGSITETSGIPEIGGFCGDNANIVTNCFWDTQTSGEDTSDGGIGKTTAQMKLEATFTDSGWDFGAVWKIDGTTNNGYPFLRSLVSLSTTKFWPSDSMTRGTGLVHRYSAGSFTLELMLGDMQTEWAISRPSLIEKPETALPEEPEVEPVIPEPPEIVPPTEPTALEAALARIRAREATTAYEAALARIKARGTTIEEIRREARLEQRRREAGIEEPELGFFGRLAKPWKWFRW